MSFLTRKPSEGWSPSQQVKIGCYCTFIWRMPLLQTLSTTSTYIKCCHSTTYAQKLPLEVIFNCFEAVYDCLTNKKNIMILWSSDCGPCQSIRCLGHTRRGPRYFKSGIGWSTTPPWTTFCPSYKELLVLYIYIDLQIKCLQKARLFVHAIQIIFK